jgi:hypothetical protein
MVLDLRVRLTCTRQLPCQNGGQQEDFRCKCNDGWHGDYCQIEEKDDPNLMWTIGAPIIAGVVLIGGITVCAVGVFLYRRLNKKEGHIMGLPVRDEYEGIPGEKNAGLIV